MPLNCMLEGSLKIIPENEVLSERISAGRWQSENQGGLVKRPRVRDHEGSSHWQVRSARTEGPRWEPTCSLPAACGGTLEMLRGTMAAYE